MIDSALGQFPVTGEQIRSSVHPLEGNTVALVTGIAGRPAAWRRYVRTFCVIGLPGVASVSSTVLAAVTTVIARGAAARSRWGPARAAEINVVLRYRLWPRSVTQALTKADKLVLIRLAQVQVCRPTRRSPRPSPARPTTIRWKACRESAMPRRKVIKSGAYAPRARCRLPRPRSLAWCSRRWICRAFHAARRASMLSPFSLPIPASAAATTAPTSRRSYSRRLRSMRPTMASPTSRSTAEWSEPGAVDRGAGLLLAGARAAGGGLGPCTDLGMLSPDPEPPLRCQRAGDGVPGHHPAGGSGDIPAGWHGAGRRSTSQSAPRPAQAPLARVMLEHRGPPILVGMSRPADFS